MLFPQILMTMDFGNILGGSELRANPMQLPAPPRKRKASTKTAIS